MLIYSFYLRRVMKEFNLSNALTLYRLLIAPVVAFFILQGNLMLATVLFTLGGVSDALDGYLARRFKWSTNFGKILDPYADKFLLGLSLIAVVYANGFLLWTWFFSGVGFFLTLHYYYFVKKEMEVNLLGKVFMVLDFIILILLVYGFVYEFMFYLIILFLSIPGFEYLLRRKK